MRGLRWRDAAVILVAAILGNAAKAHADTWEWHWHSGGGVQEVIRHCLDIF